jgi:ubiquinone/menaquinone biosynthesis C-methylase UbiE
VAQEQRYVAALRFPALTRFYDPVMRLGTRESEFKRRIVDAVAVPAGARILDLACGTGTLAIMLAKAHPDAAIAAVDGDPEVLRRARAKAHEQQVGIDFDEGLSTALPYADDSFDAVASTFFFHHLDRGSKEATIAEIRRVLKPGGRLHVADWGKPPDPLMAAAFLQVRLLDGFEVTRDNASGELPRIFERGGFTGVRESGRLRTLFGSVSIWDAALAG